MSDRESPQLRRASDRHWLGAAKRFAQVIDCITLGAAVIAALSVIALAGVTIEDIVARQFNSPLQGAEQIGTYLFVSVSMLGAGYSVRHGEMARVPLFVESLSSRSATRLTVAICVLSTVVIGIYTWTLLGAVITAYQQGILDANVYPVPQYLEYLLPVCGFVVLGLQVVSAGVTAAAGGRNQLIRSEDAPQATVDQRDATPTEDQGGQMACGEASAATTVALRVRRREGGR